MWNQIQICQGFASITFPLASLLTKVDNISFVCHSSHQQHCWAHWKPQDGRRCFPHSSHTQTRFQSQVPLKGPADRQSLHQPLHTQCQRKNQEGHSWQRWPEVLGLMQSVSSLRVLGSMSNAVFNAKKKMLTCCTSFEGKTVRTKTKQLELVCFA